ncbi:MULTISPECIES: helix-turn-helix domain-containing protein [Enterobacterales]|uniref:helix-turn-helix domain-containing protein n=1 Tax=Enterobacterales TaxID=91347 RepID=UPI000847F69A|nr:MULTISPECIES: helix-turn-helix domain-containing protein [Enterobacterales]MDM3673795.1 helix-turn-helix domain-containing protein [Proteus mirabilis]MDM3797875.1 helix-turn-helix domain-containing protein [Proteus mirabilis]MDY3693187.1 helix-turn-helix domain-containing protein [Proteus mirabilis]NBL90329.1 XRE family transcriptional regulator [Proteus sp. G2673]ODQ05219.1 DNA-binding protein [Shigella sp. FC130]
MKSIAEIRKDNLIYIIERYYEGKQKLLADALGVAPSMISRYLSPKDLKSHRELTDPMSRKIEYVTKISKYWMDVDHLKIGHVESENEEYIPTEIGKIISDNITTFMLKDGIKSRVKLAIDSGLAQSTVNRIINCEASATAESIDAIAKAMDRQAYELLIPKNNKSDINYDRKLYARLPASEQSAIENFIEFIINKHHPKDLESSAE